MAFVLLIRSRLRFASRYDAEDLSVQEDIIKFAAGKLINVDLPVQVLTGDQALACLAQRTPIELSSTNYITQASERKQVEGHMRVCLKTDATFGGMVIVSASEPILAEVAHFIMAQKIINTPIHFKSVLERLAIHKGKRGEFQTRPNFSDQPDRVLWYVKTHLTDHSLERFLQEALPDSHFGAASEPLKHYIMPKGLSEVLQGCSFNSSIVVIILIIVK